MKLIRIFIAAIFLSCFLTIAASAQTQPKPQATPQPTPQPTTQPQTQPVSPIKPPAPVPVGFIYGALFVDDKNGIKRYIAALNTINREFEAPQKELETLANRITALTNEINASQPNAPGLAAKAEELDRIKRDFEYKQKSGKAAFEKRQRELLNPIEDHIYSEVKNYAKQFGIKVVIDVGKIQDAVVFYSEEADMTRAFIADYNAKFPATTPPPTTTPVKP